MRRYASMIASISTAALSGSDGRADGRARVLAALAEHGDQEVGRAVGDQMLLGEVGRRGDEHGDLDQPADLFEVAERGLGLRKDVDGAEFGRFLARRGVEVAPEQAAGDELAVLERQLAGGEEQIAGPRERHIVGGRRRGCRQD